MKTFFWNKLRKATSGTLVLTLLFSVLNPLGLIPNVYAVPGFVPVGAFIANETISNNATATVSATTLAGGADIVNGTVPATTLAGGAEAVAATKTDAITITVTPLDGDTITIGGTVYTFRIALTNAAIEDEILIGADATSATANLISGVSGIGCIVAGGMPTTEICAGTVADANVSASAGSGGTKVTITALVAGTAWNAITISATSGDVTVLSPLADGAVAIKAQQDMTFTSTLPAGATDQTIDIDGVSIPLGNLALTTTEIATLVSGAVLTNYDLTNPSAGVVRFIAKVAGTAGNAAVTIGDASYATRAQVVTFTPASPTIWETFSGSIDGTSYNYTITGSMTVAQAVTAFQPLIDADVAVVCTDDTTTVTCTAVTPGTAFTYAAEVVDITAPTAVSITFDDVALKIGDTPMVTIVLSEAASGATFNSADVTVANGTLGTLTTADEITWTGTFTPTASLDDSSNIATIGTDWADISGNAASAGAASSNYAIDTIAPTVGLTTGAADPTNGTFTVTATFVGGGVSGMTIGDFVVVNGTASGFVQDSSMVYTAVVTPTTDGVVTVNMGTGAATDSAGNNNNAATELSIHYDATAPVISAVTVTPDVSGTGATYSYAVADMHTVTSSIFLGTGSNVLATLTASGNSTGTGTHPGSLSGLSTGTIYYYFIESVDAAGNTGTTSTGSFSTGDSAGPVISNKHVDGVTETGATVRFDFIDANYTVGTGTGSITIGTGASLSNIATGYLTVVTGSLNSASSAFSSLMSDTTYNYAISITDNFGNTSSASTGSFVTASAPVVLAGGTITETGATALTGATLASGSTLDLNGTTIIIHSDPADTNSITGNLTLSGVAGITVSGSPWNGIITPPTLVQSGAAENATSVEISAIIPQTSVVTVGNTTTTTTYASTILQTVKLGGESGVSLIASGSNFRVSFVVASSSSGTTLHLYRSTNGTTWEVSSPDATCTLDANKMCTFSTNHMSYFAPTLIASSASSVTTSSGGGGGGGGGSSGLSIDYCPTGDKSGSYYDAKCDEVVVVTATGTTTTTTNTNGTTTTTTTPTVGALLFLDISNNWAKLYIEALAKAGIINNAQYFRPNDSITRAEFLKMTLNGLKIETDKTLVQSEFSDVETTWQISFIAKAKEMGIASGQVINGELSFRPNDNITRAEAMKILLNAAGYNSVATSTNFTDVTTPWQIPFVVRAQELGIVSGQMIDGRLQFRPNDAMTRAEVSKIIVKTIQMK